jgi:hypothetical protein
LIPYSQNSKLLQSFLHTLRAKFRVVTRRTEGEERFEAYLTEMGYPFEFEKEYFGTDKRKLLLSARFVACPKTMIVNERHR